MLFAILSAAGAWRFIVAARTGAPTEQRLGAKHADQPVSYSVTMALLAGAVAVCAWMSCVSLPKGHLVVNLG